MAQQVSCAAASRNSQQHRHRTPATTFCSLQLPLPTRPTLLMSSLRLLRWDRIPRARAARRDATRAVDCVQPRWKSECAARLAAVDRVQRSRWATAQLVPLRLAKRARSILPDRHRADGRARAVCWASCCVGRYHTGVHGPDCLSWRVMAVTGVGSRQWIHFLCQDAHSLLSDGAGEYLQLVL